MAVGIASSVQPAIESNAMAAEPPDQIEGGLVRVEKAKLDLVYLLPGANFANYDRVRIDPVDVSFSPNWKPNESRRSPSQRLTADDIERIRTTVAEEFRKSFERELSNGGYSVTNEDGPDVLRLTPRIVNLYITAPDKPTAGITRTYTASTGHMTLDLTLRDSTTGQYLARAVDAVQGNHSGGFRMQVTSSVTNLGTARVAFSKWARALVQGLDEAKKDSVNAGSPTKFAEGASPR
jgi:Protein of unknown function (DUF3313)